MQLYKLACHLACKTLQLLLAIARLMRDGAAGKSNAAASVNTEWFVSFLQRNQVLS